MRPHFRTHSRRRALGLGAAALGAALLAACGGDDDDDPPPAGGASGPFLSGSLLAAESPPPDGESGILRSGTVGEPAPPGDLTYARLVSVDPRSGELDGDLAASVEQTGALELAVRLRAEAFFHPRPSDGLAQPVTAETVARDFAARADAGEFLFSSVVAAVEAPDAETLLLRLRAPFALLFEFLGDTAAAAIRSQTRSSLGIPLGGGAFAPERLEDGGITLRPHPLYHHDGLPLLDEVRIISAEREGALDAAFESGSLDLLRLVLPDSVERASRRADSLMLTRATRRLRGLGLSLVGTKGGAAVRFRETFQDDRVREALFRSLDQQEIADFEGTPPALLSGPVGPSFAADALPQEQLAAHPLFRPDPAEARKLLEAAGAAGLIFAIEAPNRAPLSELGRLLLRQLRSGGFRPTLSVVSTEDWQRHLAAGDFESILFELEPARTPDVGLRLHTSGGLDGAFSPWGYSNPVYDEAVRVALSALDPAERGRRAREAQRLLLDDTPALIPLPEPAEQIAISSLVGGYGYDAYEYNDQWLSARWHLRKRGAAPESGS